MRADVASGFLSQTVCLCVRLKGSELLNHLLHLLVFSVHGRLISVLLLLVRPNARSLALRGRRSVALGRAAGGMALYRGVVTLAALHDGFIVGLQIKRQKVLLEVYLELVHQEVLLLRSLRLLHPKIEVDSIAPLKCVHR